MAIKVEKHSYEQFTQYSFLEKDINTLYQLREAITKIFRGQTNIGNDLIIVSRIFPQDSGLYKFNLDDYTNLISFHTLRNAILKIDDSISLY